MSTTPSGSISPGPDGRYVVEARHPSFVARALHPMARVGATPVMVLSCRNGTFRGVVLGTPRPGDELVVRYPPEPELPTGVRVPAPNVA